MTMIDISIVKCYVCICNSGWFQGWHERYSLMAEEAADRKLCFDAQNYPWGNKGIAKALLRKGDVCHAL